MQKQKCKTKSVKYDSNAFFGQQMKIMLVMTNYAKNYSRTIDKGLSLCWRSNQINKDIISQSPGLKKGVEKWHFWVRNRVRI